MKYVSLDIETTGLNPKNPNNIIGISMVVEDTANPASLLSLPHFTCIVDQGRFEGEPYALWLNAWLLKQVCEARANRPTIYPVYKADHWTERARSFLTAHFGNDRITMAGKNAGVFDYQFLPSELQGQFRNRIIDPGSVLVDWNEQAPLDLSRLKARAGLNPDVSHDMYHDALDVIAVLRTTYPK